MRKHNSVGDLDYIVFLGTGGARFVVSKQLRATGGIWLSLNKTNLIIDPGPGALVRVVNSKYNLRPELLDAILVSHKHIDHSNDVNIMIEAMTGGGTKKRGILLCPQDAIDGEDRVILPYLRSYLQEIVVLKEGLEYYVNDTKISTPIKHKHPGEVYGFLIEFHSAQNKKIKIAYIADTKYFDQLALVYKSDVMIFNVIKLESSELEHLSVEDVKTIIKASNPKAAILTHFGMTMLRARPQIIAEALSRELKVKVFAAYDGMKFDLDI
ncbi:MAG: MBL fold metallo-hydrolase [candidate division WOR-3 bacterium]|nr:MBL fold metallo-hydrolase [candidate division WOR-3 bacterium]MCX7757576.1 MBL fold metallo-hydrolase [candidate division WOR-3 bacterium]MDW7987532.1 MBL fold metallo-hydrolase [candidate division WOR-3 bacterium]